MHSPAPWQEHIQNSVLGILNARVGEQTLALPLLKELLRYGRENCEIVILEGILNASWYKPLFELAIELYASNIYAYYFDIPFEETVRCHRMRSNHDIFGDEALKEWWKEKDFSELLNEVSITADQDENSIVRNIYSIL